MPRHIKALMALTVVAVAALWTVTLATDWRDVQLVLTGSSLSFGVALSVLGVMAWRRRKIEC